MPIKCNLHNPTKAARVIYDGITNQSPIRIGAGESLEGVVLAEHVVATLRQASGLGPDVDLRVEEVSEEPMAEEPEAEAAAAAAAATEVEEDDDPPPPPPPPPPPEKKAAAPSRPQTRQRGR